MRHPKNPFSSGGPAEGDAVEWPRDHRDLAPEGAPEGAPGRGRGTPPPLPRRTGDSGFRPHGGQAAGSREFWPLTDPDDSWPLAPRPEAAPAGSWSPGAPDDAWAAADPRPGDRRDEWAQGDPRDEWVHGGVQEPPMAQAPQLADPRDEWAQGDPRDEWVQAGPEEPWATLSPQRGDPGDEWVHGDAGTPWQAPAPQQDDSRDEWAEAGPQDYWDAPASPDTDSREGWAQGGPEEPWAGRGEAPDETHGWGARDSWSPDSRPQAAPRDPWPPARVREDLPAGEPGAGEVRGEGPRAEQPHQEAGPAPASMGFQDLWESWEPPYDPIGAISEPVLHPTAPYPELVRDAEYEEELGLWEAPGSGGPGGGEPYGGAPSYPGPRHRAQHARGAGRPRMNGAFLVLAAALAVAGAIPLGILGIRTLGHHGNPALRTAPLSESHAAASAPGANGAATFTALAGPGCPGAAGAGAFPYQAPNGDGWHPAAGASAGPCGNSFVFSYLAMVPGNPGEWHDHYAWVFRTGMDNPSCRFSFYIPAAPQANSTDYYWFSAGDSNAVNRIADFTIDQAVHQGQWVTKGPFTFPGGTVLIEATDRGDGAPTASVAVGPVRLSC